MSEDMTSSWRYMSSARSHISSLKGYLGTYESTSSWRSARHHVDGHESNARPETSQSWRAWAGQKMRARKTGMYPNGSSNTEMVNVFPGWATRRYPVGAPSNTQDEPKPFELEVFVSGYAISYRSPENASRSQRAFMRLAKGYAYLPKLVESVADVHANTSSLARLTPSTEELLAKVALPPRPTEITDDYDVETLDRTLRLAKTSAEANHSNTSSPSSSIEDLPGSEGAGKSTVPPPGISGYNGSMPIDVIRRLHANLERRLQPFWSSVLPNRTVRLLVFASPHNEQTEYSSSNLGESDDEISSDIERGLLAYQDVTTSADGSFQVKFKVSWEDLCYHPKALHIAFGETITEHDLLIVARLLPSAGVAHNPLEANSLPHEFTPFTSLSRIPITHSPIRVISDVDDTVKLSGILLGARAVFHNVFVKDLKDNIIPGMGEWYTHLWEKGVRFHYVSNGPFEYLPVLNEFFELSKLPVGSIKLKSYTGRSLFSGLLSAPAARKRAGVVDILDSFPDSRFFLIGDTGEQDLELYADLARERPDRILAVFVRDADSTTEPLDDPTGWNAIDDAGTRANGRPLIPRSDSDASTNSFSTLSSSKYNYSGAAGSPLNPANLDSRNTPRSSTNQQREATSSFLSSKLTSEPEDNLATPTPTSYARMESASIPQSHGSHGRHRVIPSIASRVSAKLFTDTPPKPIDPPSIKGSINTGRSSASARSQQSTSSTSSTESNGKRLSDADRKRNELQMRVYRARTQMPGNVYLRIFRDPKECVEAQQILDLEA
ncbi:hypothetical protein BDN70DRAFT_929916 [Pholiota conissans]|uniref:Phosphatidate phosphatase APP1 catalytic domain-containing protein n=1 Tax=Pholiota conissans TaxID=109636 RepID=A0A9P5Z6H9_9AGAR|nr:hypothetical protein BDN70DRAFT_929916 [Pholiota conissans]